MAENKNNFKVVVTENGPYVVSGGLPLGKEIILTDEEECPVKWGKGKGYPYKENYSLCRCGNSSNKPFCDGSHIETEFDGTETASRKKFIEEAEKFYGSELLLIDNKKLCASASFCDRAGGIWKLTKDSNPESKDIAIQEACNCPSGRLVMWDRQTGKVIEPEHRHSISLVEDPQKKVSGPIWLKGKIPVESSDGKRYETRNRVTLCRCGKSKNKPFCDGSHIEAGFNDGDESLKK